MKRSGRFYRRILAESATAMCGVDPGCLRILEANRSFLNLFGYSLREALSLTLYDLTMQDRESVDYTCKTALPSSKVLPPISLTALRKDGGEIIVECRLEWIRSRNSELLLVTLRNLSDYKEKSFLKILREICGDILRRRDRDAVLRSLLRHSMELVSASQGTLWLVAQDKKHIVPFLASDHQAPAGWTHTRSGEGLAGTVWQTGEALVVKDYSNWPHRLPAPMVHDVYTVGGFPLTDSRGTVIGVLELAHCDSFRMFDWQDRYYLGQMAQMAALELENSTLLDSARQEIQEREKAELRICEAYEALDQAYESTLIGWVQALDMRDGETQGHSRRVADMTLKLAKIIGMPETEWVHVWRGALLHDIGKMGIPDSILLYPGPLGEREWEVMRRHSMYGVEWVERVEYLKPAIPLIRHHHERWDGSGYPDGLRGTEIPLAARIFSIVDVWDALLSKRPYRAAWTQERVIGYLQENAGRQFDPDLIEVFLQLHEKNSFQQALKRLDNDLRRIGETR